MVKCRVCNEYFKKEDADWVMPSRNYYYHKECYEKFKEGKSQSSDEEWVDMIYDLIARDLKVKYSWHMIESQRKRFIKEYNYNNKGIYYALYWFFIVTKKEWNSDFGIGIIPHIYEKSRDYWTRAELQNQGIVNQIEELARQRLSPSQEIKRQERQRPKIKAPD